MRDMFFTLEKLQKRMEELKSRRYFGHQTIAPFTAMDGGLSKDEVYCKIPDKIEGRQMHIGDFFTGQDRYMWLEKEVALLPTKEGCKVAGLFNFGKTSDGFIGGNRFCMWTGNPVREWIPFIMKSYFMACLIRKSG